MRHGVICAIRSRTCRNQEEKMALCQLLGRDLHIVAMVNTKKLPVAEMS
jgi:hypothetical protein